MKTAFLFCAPDVPPSEMKKLRKWLHKVLGKKVRFVAVNYNVNVTTLVHK
jgi:hypothetical protein